MHPLLQQRRPEQPFQAIPGCCAETAHSRRDLGKGFRLFIDNLYTSVELMEHLWVRGTYACGTIRHNREGLPKALMVKKHKGLANRGDTIFYEVRQHAADVLEGPEDRPCRRSTGPSWVSAAGVFFTDKYYFFMLTPVMALKVGRGLFPTARMMPVIILTTTS